MNMDEETQKIKRLKRKLEKRDRRIAALEHRIMLLENQIATKDLQAKRLPLDVTRAVQEALCNVRMIPVLGVGKNARILDVNFSEASADG